MGPSLLNLLTLVFSLIICVSSEYPDLLLRIPSRSVRPEAETVELVKRALYGRRDDQGSLQSYDSGVLSLDRSWEDSVLLKL